MLPKTSFMVPTPAQSFSTRRPVAITMIFLGAVVFGYFSYQRLPLNLMPELNYPTLTVRTEYPGASPEEVENEISRPIEEALGVIGGLKRLSSISRAGISDVVLEFTWGTDMVEAMQDVLEKLDLVFLPREARRPLILKFDPSEDPIMELSLSGIGPTYEGESGLRRLRRIAEVEIKRLLEPIPGVAAVRVRGGLEEEYHVLLDIPEVLRLGLQPQWIINRLRQFNINVAGGTLEEGKAEYMVRTLNEFKSLEDISNTVLTAKDGKIVRLKDIARIVRAHKDRELLTKTDGYESVLIEIYKEGDANIVQVAQSIAYIIGPLNTNSQQRALSPSPFKSTGLAQKLYEEEGIVLRIVADRSKFIKSSINEVKQTALIGGILAIAVLFIFLGDIRTTLIIGLSIPMSVLISFSPLNLLNLSLNIMSLGGIALGIGMLVDNSIVVLESIFRCREEGDDIVGAAVRGTKEVASAITASTFTTVAVFLPMVFLEGVAGQAFKDLAITVVTSLLASLLVALYFIPMLASRQINVGNQSYNISFKTIMRLKAFSHFIDWWHTSRLNVKILIGWYKLGTVIILVVLELISKIVILIGGFIISIGILSLRYIWKWGYVFLLNPLCTRCQGLIRQIQTYYPLLIENSINRYYVVIGLVILIGGVAIWIATRLGTELLPEVHQGELTWEVNLPVGTPLEETVRRLEPFEQKILTIPEIERLIVTYGYDSENVRRSDEGEHTAKFKLIIKRSRSPALVEERVSKKLKDIFLNLPDIETRETRPLIFSSDPPLIVEIQSYDITKLKQLSIQVEELLRNTPYFAEVERTLRAGAPEILIKYERDLVALYGLDLAQVAQYVKDLVKGYEATKFNRLDRRVPIVVRLDEQFRETVEDIKNLVINPGSLYPIPLNAVAQIDIVEGPNEIRRVDGRRVAWIRLRPSSNYSLSDAANAAYQILNKINWPNDVSFTISGQYEEWQRSKNSLYLVLGMALFLVYAIMASQFESIIQPLIIMLTVPLAFIGSIIGLGLFGIPISVVVFLGFIILAGIVVNNAIVLIDYTNTLRSRGMYLLEAIKTAGKARLRPIFMTTATTVLGLLPMAIGLGDGAEIRRPLALTVIFGLISSTVLTLVLIPMIYYYIERGLERR